MSNDTSSSSVGNGAQEVPFYSSVKVHARERLRRRLNNRPTKPPILIDLTTDEPEEMHCTEDNANGSNNLGLSHREMDVDRNNFHGPLIPLDSSSASYCGSLDEARLLAINEKKFLLVCIGTADRKFMEVLERKLFADLDIHQGILVNCVYSKILHHDPEALRQIGRYNVTTLPTMLLLDPREGEELYRFSDSLFDARSFWKEFSNIVMNRLSHCHMKNHRSLTTSLPETSSRSLFNSRKRKISESEVPLGLKRDRPTGVCDAPFSWETNSLSNVGEEDWKQLVAPHSEPCTIRFRLPIGEGGHIETAVFSMKTQLSVVFLFISARGLSPHRHSIIISFPRREYTMKHAAMTLEDLGFTKCEHVHVDCIGIVE